MFARLALPLIALALASAQALAQSSIKPDPTPRLPPQAGQALPLKDQQFIVRAANLSEAEIQAGMLAVEKTPSGPLKAFGEKLTADHEKLRQSVNEFAKKHKVSLEPHASRTTWQGDLQRLRALSGAAFERDYLAWQLEIHLVLADLYQTQASNTPATDLAKFAIVSLKQIQDRFEEAKKLGAGHGLTINTIKAPPQY